MRVDPRTRLQGRQRTTEIDPDTKKTYVTGRTRTGRVIDKNRSDGWRGYRSHLSDRQRRLIAWALRQRDRGIRRERIWIALQEMGYQSGDMQYPFTVNTITAWEQTRRAMAKRGRSWPIQ